MEYCGVVVNLLCGAFATEKPENNSDACDGEVNVYLSNYFSWFFSTIYLNI